MKTHSARLTDPTKILTRGEMAAVLADLRRKAPRSKNTRLNLVIFRLAACCGLRASEIAMLQVADVRTELPRPHLRILSINSKPDMSGSIRSITTQSKRSLRNGSRAACAFACQ